MALTTYDELRAAVANWTLRNDLTTVIPDFIAMAEARFNREERLRTRQAVGNDELTLTSDTNPLPADFGALININLSGDTYNYALEPATPNHIDNVRAIYPAGPPVYYAINGAYIDVAPSPNGSYTAPITYYTALPALSALAPSNWLLVSAPDIYLMAALVNAWQFVGFPEEAAACETRLQQLLDAFKRDSDRVESGAAPHVIRGEPIGGC